MNCLRNAAWILSLACVFASATRADDGQGDPTFDGEGVRLVGWAGLQSLATAVVAANDGALYLGGKALGGDSSFDGAVVKLTPTGGLDSAWESSGLRRVPIDAAESADDRLAGLFELTDGSLLLSGFSVVNDLTLIENPAIAKLTSSGDLDPAFGDGGSTDFGMPWPSEDYYWAGAVHQLDGKALYFGACLDCPDNPTVTRPMLLRITTSGATDSGFSGNGWEVPTTGPWSMVYPFDVAFDPFGRILVLGLNGTTLSITRLTGGGNLDTTFGGGDGYAPITMPAGYAYPYALTRDPATGALFLSLSFTSGPYDDHAGVLRFAADGAPDNSFAGDGLAELLFDDRLTVLAIAPQTDGKLVGSGFIWNVGSDTDFCIFRLEADGDLDPTFHSNGARRIEFGQTPDLSDYGRSITLSGGRLVVVGPVPTAGVESYGIARTTSTHIFTDGFDRGSSASWLGN